MNEVSCMHCFRVFIFLVSIIFGTTSFSAVEETVPARKVFKAFNSFSRRVTKQAVIKALNRTEKLETALFYPMDMNAVPDQTLLLTRLRLIRERFNHPNTKAIFGPIIRNLRKLVNNRIDLARIDQNVLAEDGVRGIFDHPDFHPSIPNALRSITGVIFHITKSLDGEGDINEGVERGGSGILVNFIQDGDNVPNVQPLGAVLPGVAGAQQLNGVLTCAHVLTSNGGDAIEVYFVPSSELNLHFGLPRDLALLGPHPAANSTDLINFLRTNPNSFRITEYSLWQRPAPVAAVVPAPGNSMAVTNPMYLNNEDMIVASIVGNQVPGAAGGGSTS